MGLGTWGRRNNLTTGFKWEYMDQVLKLNVQRAGAREGTASRGEIPIMESGRSENRRPESNTGGGPIRSFPNGKGGAPEADAAVAAFGDAAERERKDETRGRGEEHEKIQLGKQREESDWGSDYEESDWGYGSGYGYGQRGGIVYNGKR